MANDMRVDLNFVDHPKVKKLIRRAGYESFYGLMRIFSIAGKMYTKGLFKGCSTEDIEDYADWNGEQGNFVKTLIEVGLLDSTDEGYVIHDWEIHQPWIYYAEERSEKAKQSANARWNKEENIEINASNADIMRDACETHTERNAPSPSPSPIPNTITPKNIVGNEQDRVEYSTIIAYLNEKAGKNFKQVGATKKLIRARLAEGFTVQDFMTVIDKKVSTWKGTEWEQYLRPSTLFNASKFEGYLNEDTIKTNQPQQQKINDKFEEQYKEWAK